MAGRGEGPTQPVAPGWREVFRVRGRLTAGLVLLETVTAVQVLIVITVLPVIVRDLGGLRFYGWAISASPLAVVIALPAAGRWADRWGPAPALAVVLGVFGVGTLVAALAPSMLVFVAGRFLQGWGLGAQYAVSLASVAKLYPEDHRPRVLALISAAWVAPGLFGPPLGALLATTLGWRWAFFASLPPAAAAAWLVLPEMAGQPRSERGQRVPLAWLVPLAVGTGALLIALTRIAWWTAPVAVGGAAVLVPALRHLLPPGALTARPGLPAAASSMFLVSFAYFAVDGFVPLLLTRVRGESVAVAGIVVTLATLGWSAGAWWQSRVVSVRSRASLARLGTVLIVVGSLGVWAGLLRAIPVAIPYVAWTVAGVGIGITWTTISLVAMERAEPGAQASAVAAVQLTEALGSSLGPGLGGAAIAMATSAGAGLAVGLHGAFALAVAASVLLLPVCSRLPGTPVAPPVGAGPAPEVPFLPTA